MCDEGPLFLIFLLHGDLMLPLSSVNEAIELVTSCEIYQLINYWQWIAVFRACFFEVRVVDTHSVLSISFLNQHYIYYPLRVCNFSNKSGVQQFLCFLAISFCLSYVNFLFFWITSFIIELIFRLCEAIRGSTSTISMAFQAKLSECWERTLLMSSLTLDLSFNPTLTTFSPNIYNV